MYDSMEKFGWDNVMKLVQYMRLISDASIHFRADREYDASSPRDVSRMTQFFKLFGAMKGDRQNVYCTVTASDFRSNHTTVW